MADPHAAVAHSGARYHQAYHAVADAVCRTFPKARPVMEWNMVGWKVARPKDRIEPAQGTYDASIIFIGLADRMAGPTLHIWHPGSYDLLEKNEDWLKGAGFKVMKGCLRWTRKADYPAEAVAKLMQYVKAVDGPRKT
jgi:hypothetical protein